MTFHKYLSRKWYEEQSPDTPSKTQSIVPYKNDFAEDNATTQKGGDFNVKYTYWGSKLITTKKELYLVALNWL